MEEDERLRELAQEIADLEYQKLALEKEKELKLKAIGLKIQNLPRRFSAAHPLISSIAGGLGKGAFKVAKASYRLAQQEADRQRAEELRRAEIERKRRKLAEG